MLLKERLQLIMKANRLSASEFADMIGVNRASLSHVLSGRNKPSMDFLAKIIQHFPNVNASWLLTGETREGDFEDKGGVIELGDVKKIESVNTQQIDRIVIFYKDGTFAEYKEVN